MNAPLLSVSGVSKVYSTMSRRVAALDGASISVARGETIGLVGPSGSGKSTLARVLLRLIEPDSGSIEFGGEDLLALKGEALRTMRRRIQMVFQDPLGAFNPRATVASALSDPLRIHALAGRRERPAVIAGLLERVGLDPALAARAIHEISGGQRQRVAIARALATKPELIVLDEAVSALDVSVRGRILELLVSLQREEGIAYVFVSHDLAVVRAIAHTVAIMDAGRIVEAGATPDVVSNPQSETGRALVAAVPRLTIQGSGG
ncbi:MAG: ATP-binding cassette domain-containing protein [Alphaproteobacteria bacterium]|nr:ATP-binding cassette domain-containing protein [Alphaproteobacteria bacterium]MBU0806167.1 ATP-binding cassette domain-containing protein [Alphaproteobacteria bacterium]MBU0874248.1 ATP-binding cassette domain-containing protein [Alphaproteobacteria bacterium]MBU1400475.1 ATP-binding cassette domain-containing protein [Alphaproteobacteria bacterium]MBU1592913.1 ATP-binding cassette domain-containing protein [Alphaproteobacteria bacterium]